MKRNSGVIGGVILILLGLLFLLKEIYPDIFSFWDWPLIIVSVGLVFLLWAIISGNGGLAIPGTILLGLGGILYYQNATGDWSSWSFAWALMPGFVGLGILLAGIISRQFRQGLTSGLTLIAISAIFFFAFGSFFGISPEITRYWPLLLIAIGIITLIRLLIPDRKKTNHKV